jgi:hypothetical protein
VEVPTFVGGVRTDQESRTVCQTKVTQTASGVEYVETVRHSRFEYRGGVDARVKISATDVAPGALNQVRRKVLDARPSAETVSWRIS